MKLKFSRNLTLFGVVATGLIILTAFQFRVLIKQKSDLTYEIGEKNIALSALKYENSQLTEALNNTNETVITLEDKIKSLTDKVGDLTRLKETDPELLKKYSKVYFLSDNYTPKGLAPIPDKYVLDKNKKPLFLLQALPKLTDMIERAKIDNANLFIASAYRSFDMQNDLKNTYKVIYGAGTANSFSADQGYSEHQLGTAIDFTTQKIGGGLAGFDKTAEYAWLVANAYKFGFVLSYPPHNNYYVFEPWHWRFVGVALATRLHEDRQYFVELGQRQIDPYLANIFD